MTQTLLSYDQARLILQRVAQDTRQNIADLAAQEGFVFDNEQFSDADILRAMLQAAGVTQIFDEVGARDLIDQLPFLLESSN